MIPYPPRPASKEPVKDGAMTYTPTFLERIGRKLFPSRYVEPPEPDFEYKDQLTCLIKVQLSFADRIRTLISGRVIVQVKVATENEIGKNFAFSGFEVCPPEFLERKPLPPIQPMESPYHIEGSIGDLFKRGKEAQTVGPLCFACKGKGWQYSLDGKKEECVVCKGTKVRVV